MSVMMHEQRIFCLICVSDSISFMKAVISDDKL